MIYNFIVNVFYTIAEVSSIIFDSCQQFFADAKIFELERLLKLTKSTYFDILFDICCLRTTF